jgi:hypothetical protein
MLLLEYDEEEIASCGVVCAVAGPIPYYRKEPVGHVFHYKMLLQQGLIGTELAQQQCHSNIICSVQNFHVVPCSQVAMCNMMFEAGTWLSSA